VVFDVVQFCVKEIGISCLNLIELICLVTG
jgi:hypothetical protein